MTSYTFNVTIRATAKVCAINETVARAVLSTLVDRLQVDPKLIENHYPDAMVQDFEVASDPDLTSIAAE